ncbi:head-tail connector protein [Pseudorhodobacter sp.]|uniref:head-tail connector protein n=1 Tax=Pseudorhodobacter sp. TaxID=1934400 RepID=UPI0026471420|nr:head-tail connector protein [Pseudorhodobacter sp.]MDN5786234.1 head-tail connector protein [Pseudorhodobacter sp.]
MRLIEQTTVPALALPVQALKNHLRLGTGFADDGMQDGLIESYLRAAMVAIEGRIGKVLIARDYLWVLEDWRGADAQALPVAPVTAIASVTLRDAAGGGQAVPNVAYRLVKDTHRPRVQAVGSALPQVPQGGCVEIAFTAGFGAAWADIAADLAQAVLMLAAEYYEHRHEGGAREAGGLPFGVVTLIERWRNVRVLGGAGA